MCSVDGSLVRLGLLALGYDLFLIILAMHQFAYLFDGHGLPPLDPVHEVKVAHLVVVGGADAHVVVCNFTIIQISLQKELCILFYSYRGG